MCVNFSEVLMAIKLMAIIKLMILFYFSAPTMAVMSVAGVGADWRAVFYEFHHLFCCFWCQGSDFFVNSSHFHTIY